MLNSILGKKIAGIKTITKISFTFATYQRPFLTPLVTHHGTWSIREGIILYLTNEQDQVAKGEIAPLPWFGSESIAQAIAFCQEVKGKNLTKNIIREIPPQLTACQFGFEMAWENLHNPDPVIDDSLSYSYLLPRGEKAIAICQTEREKGRKTFKWKIGVESPETELLIFQEIINVLKGAKLRLDANGGLNQAEAIAWLRAADASGMVEFIEQPLPPSEFQTMLELSKQYQTAIALDESVATLTDLETCYHRGWRGIYIIKPAIAGSPQKLKQLCQQYQLDVVFSSVFETEIGRQAILKLATELTAQRPLGFSVNHWFGES
jgi:O-succinylbenzoate synthase